VKINGSRPWDIRVHDERFFQRVLGTDPGSGRGLHDGWWDCDQLDEMLTRVLRNGIERNLRSPRAFLLAVQPISSTCRIATGLHRRQAALRPRRRLYERMLDPRMIYTCAYWRMRSLSIQRRRRSSSRRAQDGFGARPAVLDIAAVGAARRNSLRSATSVGYRRDRLAKPAHTAQRRWRRPSSGHPAAGLPQPLRATSTPSIRSGCSSTSACVTTAHT